MRALLRPGAFTFEADTERKNVRDIGFTHDSLDGTSRKLLNQIDELKRLELEKRRAARDSDAFRDLAARVETAARDIFNTAAVQRSEGEKDSPLEEERDEQHPADWTEGSRN
jgi:hypothetical protein